MEEPHTTPSARLAGRDPIEVLQATPAYLAELFESLPEDVLDVPYAPGKWSPRQVISHLADVELATEREFKDRFPDCEVGAMPPFGNLFDMDVYVSECLSENDEIAFNAGTHTELIRMSYSDYERLVRPKIVRLSYSDSGWI